MTDKEQYQENTIFNIHYLIRDILTTEQVKELKDFCDEQLYEREQTWSELTKTKQNGI